MRPQHLTIFGMLALWALTFSIKGIGQVGSGLGPQAMPPMPLSVSPTDGIKLLKPASQVLRISMKDAFKRALRHHAALELARNQLKQKEVDTLASWARFLPHIHLSSAYTRNFPEVKKSFSPNGQSQASLYTQAASLLRRSGELSFADQLDRQAALMQRRDTNGKFVISPKDVFESKLSAQMPIFHGPGIAQIMVSHEAEQLVSAKVREQEANTIYLTAKYYFQALHLRNVLTLREQAEVHAEEGSKKAESQKKRELIAKKDYLEAKANYRQ